MVYRIWEFKNKDKLNKEHIEYDPEQDTYKMSTFNYHKERKQTLNQFLSKNNYEDPKNFNKWFNEQFEKNKLETEDQTTGYGDWLKSDEDLEDIKILNHTQLGEEIEKKKSQLRSLIVHKEVTELDLFYKGASNLTGDAPESYTSDLFSQLPYEDLRKAHTETVIPVTMEDYMNTSKYQDVNQYKQYRSQQNTAPLSEKQAQEFLNNKYKIQERETTERAYKLAKQLEDSKNKQENLWASMKYISNK